MTELSNYISVILTPPKGIPFEKLAKFQLQASWDDVAAKAKRLVQDGAVTVLRNSPTHVMGHIVGDHGEYNAEIARTDPVSQTIEQWNCECPWNQFAFDRTRKWKALEGRVCILPGMQVTMADGSHKPIESVVVGDRVLTHDGIGTVSQTTVNPHKGDILEVYRIGFPDPLRLTPEHEVLSVLIPDKVRNASYNLINPGSNQGFKIPKAAEILSVEPDWVDAGDLQVHDWVSSTWLPEGREGSVALGTVLGFYLAEGNLAKRTRSPVWGEVQWTFGRDEQYLVDQLQQALTALGYGEVRTYFPRHNAISVRLTSRDLAEQLEVLGGHLARSKCLAPEVFTWSREALMAMVEAFALGDGTLMRSDRRTCLYTSSDVLVRQLYEILLVCGITPSWSRAKNNMGPANREGVTTMNRVYFVPEARQINGRRRFENHYISKINRIERVTYDGPIYNLSVDSQESYVIEGVCVHNCSHVMALYWKSKGTPLDMSDQDSGFTPPGGQKIGPTPGQQSIPGVHGQPPAPASVPYGQKGTEPVDLSQGGNQPPAPGPVLPSNTDLIQGQPPQPPYNFPKAQPAQPQLQQLHLFDITAPPGMQPVPQGSPVSVPGGRPPTPGSPVVFPGTFSHFIPMFTIRSNHFIYAGDELSDYFELQRAQGQPIYAALTTPVTLELRGGKIPIPGAQSIGTSSEGIPMYRVLDLGWNPETGERENANTNALMGAPEQTGTYADVPVNKQGEVLDYNPDLKMAYLAVPLNYPGGEDARLHPHQAIGWVDYNSLRPLPNRTRPPVRRRRI